MKTLSARVVVLALAGAIGATHMAAQSVLLDDFASMRQNGQPAPLWSGMNNQGPTTCSVSNNTLVCKTQGTAPDGLGFWIMTLACDSTTCYSDPKSYLKSWIKSGTWNAEANRMRFSYKCSAPITASTNGGHWLEIGTYVRNPNEPNPPQSGQGQHYYHFINQPSQANEWVYVELNRYVQHRVGEAGSTVYPEDPEWNAKTMTNPVHYFDGMTHFYFGPTYSTSLRAAGTTCTMGAFTLDLVRNGSDSYVSGVAGSYNPSTGKYDVSWNQPKNVPRGVTYDVRYSTSSIRSSGWSRATAAGSIVGPDDSAYTAVNLSSPSVSRAGSMYFAIRPKMPIAAISKTSPAQVTFSSEHSLTDGDQIVIANVQQSAGSAHPMNGTYTVRVVNSKTVSLDGSNGTSWPSIAAYTGTGTATAENKNFAEFVVGPGGGSSSPAPSPCDVSGDGSVNQTDVDAAISSALGKTACSNDLDGNGRCDVVDVQRVVNATLPGGTCRTGQ